jgi:hypothetical protein
MTKRLKQACEMFDISVMDHIIATAQGYYSFADNGDSSLAGPQSDDLVSAIRERILIALKRVTRANSPNIHRMIQTPEGYAKVEQIILDKVLADNRIPEAVIPQLEMQWSL